MVKVPLWEQTPGALAALINTGKFVYSNLVTISFNSSSDFVPHQITGLAVPGSGSVDKEYQWSPDSSKIAFTRLGDIMSLKPDGSGLTSLVTKASLSSTSLSSPSYSPDGTKIAFAAYHSGNGYIYTANADGSSPTQIYVDTGQALTINGLHWGSNNKIVFAAYTTKQIWTINPDGSGAASLANTDGSLNPFYPKWSPDASLIVFTQLDLTPTGDAQVYTLTADGSTIARLTNVQSPGWVGFRPSWLPNGKIIYTASLTANQLSGPGLWIMGGDGSSPHKIYTPFAKYALTEQNFTPPPDFPAISPDGNWCVFWLTPWLELAFNGIWIFKIPIPLKLRESMVVSAASSAPVSNIFLTDADTNITLYAGSPEWDSRTVLLDKANSQMDAHWKRGLDVDQSIVVLSPRLKDPTTGAAYPDKIGNIPWVAAATAGVFGAVDVQIDRAYFDTWPPPLPETITPVGVLTIFAGQAVEIDTTDTSVVLTLNDYRQLLATMIPPDVYEAQCRWTLFSPGCRLLESAFRVTGSLVGGSTRSALLSTTIVPGGSGTFKQGKIRMTSGNNAGFVRTITDWSAPNSLKLMNPFPFTVQIGDTFEVFPGCNKTLAACTLFGNEENHGGFTTIPTATSAI